MDILLILFIIVCFNGLSFAKKGCYFSPMDRENTNAIKGVFVFFVLCRHFNQSIGSGKTINSMFYLINSNLKQLLVVPFLFYVGYGLMRAQTIKKEYLKSFIVQKPFKLLLQFDFAIIFYIITNAIIGNFFPLHRIMLSFAGLRNIGNSNWFFVITFLLYLLFFVSQSLPFNKTIKGLVLLLLSILLQVLMIHFRRPDFWYNTILAFPLGALFALFEERIVCFIKQSVTVYFTILSFVLASFYLTFFSGNIVMYSINVALFCMAIVLFSFKIRIGNPVLYLLNEYSFNIYILQRIPMILIDYFFNAKNHVIIAFILVFFVTLFLSLLFDKMVKKMYIILKV